MGREAEAEANFAGTNGAVRAILEAQDLILRGAVKARFPRQTISGFHADGPDLVVQTAQGPLRLTLGEREAVRWVTALAKAPPGLTAKLGLGADRLVHLLTPLTDSTLIAATAPFVTPAATAACLLAELPDAACFADLQPQLARWPTLAFWGATRKGRASAFSENALRCLMRAMGYMDVKNCAVSAEWTATRYHPQARPAVAHVLP